MPAALPPPALPPVLRLRTGLWITAIREGFIALLPLTLLGALALVLSEAAMLLRSQVGWHDTGVLLVSAARRIFDATMGIMGFASAVAIAARATSLLSAHDPANGPPQISVGALAGAAFLLSVVPDRSADLRLLGHGHVLHGILTGLLSAELSCSLNRRLQRTRGLRGLEGRTLLRQALRMSWIAIVVLGLVVAVSTWLERLLPPWIDAAWRLLGAGLEALQPGPVLLNGLMTLLNQVIWLSALNGGQVLMELAGRGILPLASPQHAWSDHLASPVFMNAFGHLGGAGATWGLILAALWRSRESGTHRLALMSATPAVVNVNELLLFGLPLVFNPRMVLPFLLVPTLNVLIAGQLVASGALTLGPTVVGWSTPVLISGVTLTQSLWGGALQLALIVLDACLWAPFLHRLEGLRRQRVEGEFERTLQILMSPPPAGERLLDRADLVGDLARRLMEDFDQDLRAGRVHLVYQPQHDREAKVVGVEALMRWQHAQFGAIPPAAVVNVAEECEQIHALGAWVVGQACRDLAALHQDGHHNLMMSINMSPLQAEHSGWPEVVMQALQANQLRPGELNIEITEGRNLSNTPRSELTLRRLEQLGVHLSMEDFGMGCTSLLYMQRFRMHAIKLDGALTRDVLSNRVNQDIIRAVVRLGHAQEVKVVAEFVESTDQQALLQDLGCDSFQGWLYSRALDAAALRLYLQQATSAPPVPPAQAERLQRPVRHLLDLAAGRPLAPNPAQDAN